MNLEKGRHMEIKEVPYEGVIRLRDETIHFCRADKGDIPQIASLYKKIAVTRHNYQERMDENSPGSFVRHGGMFLLMDQGDIEAELENPHSFWAVFKSEAGKVIGSFWFADHNELLPVWCIPGTVEAARQTVYPREIIVPPEQKGRCIGRLLYATVFASMLKAGYMRSICDVYRVAAVWAEGEPQRALDLLNGPSLRTILGLGGRYLGAGIKAQIPLEGMKVYIEPQIFEMEHAYALLLCASALRRRGIEVEAAGCEKNRV